jgi:2,4-dichlorophenol 6-monooxygenase
MEQTMIETEVLIIGSGPAGSTTALALSTYGIKNIVVTKYRWLAETPRAHITNQRALEIFRDMGVEEDVKRLAVKQEWMGNTVFCTALAGEELGRIQTWGTHPRRQADYTLASPCTICDLPQNLLEPILFGGAAERGTRPRFDFEYLSHVQDETGVTTTVRDRLSGEEQTIRSKYLVGADGGRSKVAEDIGLPFEGKMGVGGSMNIVFEADLSAYVAHRPSVLYWVLQPGSNIGGIGMGLVRMVRPWNEWLIVWGYDINAEPPKMTDELATEIAHKLIGDSSIPIKIKSYSIWTVNNMYATALSKGRVFCMGDAVHRHPPSNGLGSNTSVQDAYNLAWKLAAVLRGQAEPSLLDSYDQERAPIAKQIVTRANQSIAEFGPIFEALGLLNTEDPEVMREHMAARKDNNPTAAAQREALRKAIAFKDYEFNCHGVELNQRYNSVAVVPDAEPDAGFARDRELYYQPTTRAGAHLPHVWLLRAGRKISTLDVAGKGRFVVLTGIGGEAWASAAAAAAAKFGIDIAAAVIGPDRDYEDPHGDWAEIREIAEAGCVLVRPDMQIGFRAMRAALDVRDAETTLFAALGQILGRRQADAISQAA